MRWQAIESAPKEIISTDGRNRYGPYILGYVGNQILRLRWWDANKGDEKKYCNFLGDCGNAYNPSYWMPLPKPPEKL